MFDASHLLALCTLDMAPVIAIDPAAQGKGTTGICATRSGNLHILHNVSLGT